MGILDSVSSSLTRGASRAVMTSKRGNKNYYKGKGTGRLGSWTNKNRYVLEKWRLREYVIPELDCTVSLIYIKRKLKPFMAPNTNILFKKSHSVVDWIQNAELDPIVKSRCLEYIKK